MFMFGSVTVLTKSKMCITAYWPRCSSEGLHRQHNDHHNDKHTHFCHFLANGMSMTQPTNYPSAPGVRSWVCWAGLQSGYTAQPTNCPSVAEVRYNIGFAGRGFRLVS